MINIFRLKEYLAEYKTWIKLVEDEFAKQERIQAGECLGFDCNNCRCDLSPDCD